MGTVDVSVRGSFPPQRFVDALTDFGPDRSQYWGNSQDGFLEVHDRGDTWAEVTEGSTVAGGLWQRYRYDWSTPGTVRLTVLDSNAFGHGSSWTYVVTPTSSGSQIHLTILRKPTTTKGRLLEPFLAIGAPRFFRRDLRRTVKKLESAQLDPPG